MLDLTTDGLIRGWEGMTMADPQETLALLQDPVAERLLRSTNVAHLAYTWPDGSPRVVPIWFHWTGRELVLASPPDAPKIGALETGRQVAISIDDASAFPYKALLIRGPAEVQIVSGVPSEYVAAAERYFGPEQARAWVEQVRQLQPEMARIAVRPEWVAILDFETRFPSALARRMSAGR
jgi:hypothetical protein